MDIPILPPDSVILKEIKSGMDFPILPPTASFLKKLNQTAQFFKNE